MKRGRAGGGAASAKVGASPVAMRGCLIELRERSAAAGRADEVALIDATLAGDVRATVIAKIGPAVHLTEKQWEVVELIERHRRELGYAPTLDEMAAELGVSKVTVFNHVEALRTKGVLAPAGFHAHRGLAIAARN